MRPDIKHITRESDNLLLIDWLTHIIIGSLFLIDIIGEVTLKRILIKKKVCC